jgi:hypothetical protein
MAIGHSRPRPASSSLLALLHPRGQTRLVAGLLAAGLPAAWLSVTQLRLPLWGAAASVVGLLAYPAVRKWRLDQRRLGTPAMVLSILLVTQSLHTVEHLAQWVQYYLLAWPLKASSGLISPLNAEIVHFSWNLAVLLIVIWLIQSELRNRWMWLLLLWAGAHTAEHTYMFANYVQEIQRLASEGLPLSAAQGLPGFFGRNGWLAANMPAAGPVAWLCQLAPGLTNAPRLDVHFWWNLGEIGLLFAAANSSMRQQREH